MKCSDCDTDLVGQVYWTEIKGWEQRRTQGGTNHVALREPTGKYLCGGCMHLRQSGVPRGQESLV